MSATGDHVRVFVNGEARTLTVGTTVADLVATNGQGTKGIAVAVNGEVVPRSSWGAASLSAGDRVEVLSAAQGG